MLNIWFICVDIFRFGWFSPLQAIQLSSNTCKRFLLPPAMKYLTLNRTLHKFVSINLWHRPFSVSMMNSVIYVVARYECRMNLWSGWPRVKSYDNYYFESFKLISSAQFGKNELCLYVWMSVQRYTFEWPFESAKPLDQIIKMHTMSPMKFICSYGIVNMREKFPRKSLLTARWV